MIRAGSLRKEYDGFAALDDVSFEIGESAIFGVIGHNGAGKTTLLKILSGLITPTAGRLVVDGIDVLRQPLELKRRLGYLPEESRLYETMTVPAYLRFFGEIYGMDAAGIERRSRDLLRTLSLEPDGRKIQALSKDMRRKVAIARSLLHDPRLLVYDEPTSGLDPMTSRDILEYLGNLRREGKTIVLSAHNLHQVEEICDTVMILRRGKAVACGSMQELRERFGSITYRIFFYGTAVEAARGGFPAVRDGGLYRAEASDIAGMNRITAEIAEMGGTVERIESRYPSLEEMLVKIGT